MKKTNKTKNRQKQNNLSPKKTELIRNRGGLSHLDKEYIQLTSFLIVNQLYRQWTVKRSAVVHR